MPPRGAAGLTLAHFGLGLMPERHQPTIEAFPNTLLLR